MASTSPMYEALLTGDTHSHRSIRIFKQSVAAILAGVVLVSSVACIGRSALEEGNVTAPVELPATRIEHKSGSRPKVRCEWSVTNKQTTLQGEFAFPITNQYPCWAACQLLAEATEPTDFCPPYDGVYSGGSVWRSQSFQICWNAMRNIAMTLRDHCDKTGYDWCGSTWGATPGRKGLCRDYRRWIGSTNSTVQD